MIEKNLVGSKDSSESSQKVVLYKKTQVENGFKHHCGMWTELSNSVKKNLSLFWFEETDTQMTFILMLKSTKTNIFNLFQGKCLMTMILEIRPPWK